MEPLLIEATTDTPEIKFDPGNEHFSISGRSLPENSIGFFQPVFDWLNQYYGAPNPKTVFNFKLDYFNTASAKQIAKILLFFEKLKEKTDISVKWYYNEEDTDMQSSGARYSKLIDIPFELLEI